MTRGIWEFDILANGSGLSIATGVTVTVRRESDNELAVLSQDVGGDSPLPNPFNPAGSRVVFYALQDDRYRIGLIDGDGLSRTLRHQSVSMSLSDVPEPPEPTPEPNRVFATRADMVADSTVSVGDLVRILGLSTPGDGGARDYLVVENGTATSFGLLFEDLTGSGHEAKCLGGGVISQTVVNIPTDYSDLQSAFDDLGSKFVVKNNANLQVNMEAGFSPTSGLRIVREAFDAYIITADDDETFANLPDNEDFILAINSSVGPELRALVNMQGSGNHGYSVQEFSEGRIGRGGEQEDPATAIYGFKNARLRNVDCGNVSSVQAENTILTGAGQRNVSARSLSRVNCRGSQLNGGVTGVFSSRLAFVSAEQSDISGTSGLSARCLRGGQINITDSTTVNSPSSGVPARQDCNVPYNTMTGDGFVTVQPSAVFGVEVFRGDNVSFSGNETKEVILRSAPRSLLGGSVFGFAVRVFVKVGGTTIFDSEGTARGETENEDDNFSCVVIPHFYTTDGNLSVEIRNQSGGTRNIGYNIFLGQ